VTRYILDSLDPQSTTVSTICSKVKRKRRQATSTEDPHMDPGMFSDEAPSKLVPFGAKVIAAVFFRHGRYIMMQCYA